MLKESFFFLRSYKYEHFKRNFFCGTNVEGGVEDVAFPVFGFCQDHSNRGLTYTISMLQFQETIIIIIFILVDCSSTMLLSKR